MVCKDWYHLMVARRKRRFDPKWYTQVSSFVNTIPRLMWAFENDCPRDARICEYAARSKDTLVLDWVLEQKCGGTDTLASICRGLARGGQLDRLKQALGGNDCIGMNLAACAARGGHVDVLEWLSSLPNCPFGRLVWRVAADGGHVSVLNWLKPQNIPRDGSVLRLAAFRGHIQALEWYETHIGSLSSHLIDIMGLAAAGGKIALLKWLRDERKMPLIKDACSSAAKYGQIETLRWLIANKCPYDWQLILAAVKRDQVHVLEWCLHSGVWTSVQHGLCSFRKDGVLESRCGRYFRENRCPCGGLSVYASAILNDSTTCIQWLLDHNIPMCSYAVYAAAGQGNLEVMQAVKAKGFPINFKKCLVVAIEKNCTSMVEWLEGELSAC